MTKITAIDIHWAGPGWYVRLITLDGSKDREKHEYRRIAPINARIADIQETVKEYERPPDYLTPAVKRWKTRPEDKGVQRVFDVAEE